MKKIVTSILFLTFLMAFSACENDDLSSTSVIIDSINEQNDFDEWLDLNYRAAYNIKFKYKYEDIESDLSYDLVPAETSECIILAKMIKYLWLEPYTEAGGLDFVRTYTPRVFHVIGTVGWNSNNTYTMGTAEGGLKITLYAGNWLYNWFAVDYDENGDIHYTLDMDNINYYYLHTIHHEFGHILHQTKNYPTEFNLISAGNYATNWNDYSETTALQLGFISAYARADVEDDFVETLSYYITYSDDVWASKMKTAGTSGAAIIESKLNIIKEYMIDSWNIDLDNLKDILSRRYDDIYDIDWINL